MFNISPAKRKIALGVALIALISGIGVTTLLAPPPDVGAHIHTEILNHPADGFPIPREKYTFHVILRLHDNPGRLTSFESRAVNLAGCEDCSIAFDYIIDFSKYAVGRHELRWQARIKDQDLELAGNQGQITTSRSQVCIVSCTPNHMFNRPTPYNGGGGWYKKNGYQVVVLLSNETHVKPGGQVIVKSGQDKVKQICAFLNPDFHNLSSGIVLDCWTNKRDHVINIPDTANVGDKLVLYATDGFNAGVFRIFLGDGTPRPVMSYEYQSWWAKGGLVLP